MNGPNPTPWLQRFWQALFLLICLALAARFIFEVLSPLLPALGVLVVLVAAACWFADRKRW